MHSVRRHSAIQWSDHRVFHQLAQCHTVVRSSCIRPVMTVVRSSCIPPVSTVSHNGQIIVLSTSQHSTIRWSDHRAFHQSAQYHTVVIPPVSTVVRSSCIPPISTVPHGGQIIVHSTSQHSTTWWADHHAFHQSAQYHMVGRSLCIPSVSTVP